jgi:hypothetical protein
MKPGQIRKGSLGVRLQRKGFVRHFPVHRLILETFIGPRPQGFECRHLNGDPKDNRLSNLCWGTHRANKEDMIRHNTTLRGEKNWNAKLTLEQVLAIRAEDRTYGNQCKVARRYGVTPATICEIWKGTSWSWLDS